VGAARDFRPVFEYVGKLLENGEFSKLKGLIYFTDGRGEYPRKMPPYETAFVFLKEDYDDTGAPPWAIKLEI
ncbi:MAG: metallopeptidase, partial [Butyrivibrio sp.]|nr:metallopeptidase [Butyrivibrio sp.]